MISKTAEQMWGAAHLMLSPGTLIDKFLDQLEELSVALVPVRTDGLACAVVRNEALLEKFSA
jgi:hypothetical protein